MSIETLLAELPFALSLSKCCPTKPIDSGRTTYAQDNCCAWLQRALRQAQRERCFFQPAELPS